MTVSELRKQLQGVPGSWEVRPEWARGHTPSDGEPGVCLHGFTVNRRSNEVLARVSLFYLDEVEDDE